MTQPEEIVMRPQGMTPDNPKYGKGEHTIRFPDEMIADEEKLCQLLLDTFRDPRFKPPVLPRIAVQLMEISRRPDIEYERIVELLEQDAVLAGRVLQIAQSPAFSSGKPIRSLREALVRLGLNNLRDIVVGVCMSMKVFRSKQYGEAMDRLQRHCAVVALMCRVVCRYTAIAPEYAYLCGLLHDVGIAGVLLALDTSAPRDAPKIPIDMLWPALDRIHEEASQNLVLLWKLPTDIQIIVGHHHAPIIDGYLHPLGAVVCLAEHLANELGVTLSDCAMRIDRSTEMMIQRIRTELRINDKMFEKIHEECEAIVGGAH